MTRHLLHRGWVRPGLVLGLLGLGLLALLLMRSQPARAGGEPDPIYMVTAPLAVGPGQSAEVAFFLPAVQKRHPARVRLELVDAESGKVLAQQDFQADRPGGGCLKLNPQVNELPGRQQIIAILIGLLQPSMPAPTA